MNEHENDDLLTAADIEAARPQVREDGLIDVFVDELPTTALRLLLRDHMLWLFVGAAIAAMGFIMPGSAWYLTIGRGILLFFGMGFAGIRLFQINAIIAEFKRRENGAVAALRERPELDLLAAEEAED